MNGSSIADLARFWLQNPSAPALDCVGEARVVRLSPLAVSDDYTFYFQVLRDQNLEARIAAALFNRRLLNLKLGYSWIEFCAEREAGSCAFAVRLGSPRVLALPESKLIRLKNRPLRVVSDPPFQAAFIARFGTPPVAFPSQRLSRVLCSEFYDLTRPFSDSEELEGARATRRSRPLPVLTID